MSPLPSSQTAPRRKTTPLSGTADATPKPAESRTESGVGLGFRFMAPHARRVTERVRHAPGLAKTFDRISALWGKLVEAFCQSIEPILDRRFPELRLVAVADGGGELSLHRIGRDGSSLLGALDAMAPEALARLAATRWSAVELRLPATQILERKLSLPAASRGFLAPILEHRLDRLTPWRSDKVLYGFRSDDTPSAGNVNVTVTATSRDIVQPSMDRLAAAGLAPTVIGAEPGRPEQPVSVNLLGGSAALGPRAESRRFVSRLALGLGSVLLAACLGTAIIASGAAADRAASGQKLVKARRLLRAATIGVTGSREEAMLDAKQPARSTVVLMDRLATSIPADTYLKELTVQPDKVRVVGSSSNAPALIAELEAAGLSNVRFTSTITRDRSGRDDFELNADRPMPKPEDTP